MGEARTELVVEGRPSGNLRAAFREAWQFRSTALAFAERDVRVKYKQAVLGVAWAVIQPLAFMAIFTVTLGKQAVGSADFSGGVCVQPRR
jgi:ABC-type polysaccharide/polyol phosphate export permease